MQTQSNIPTAAPVTPQPQQQPETREDKLTRAQALVSSAYRHTDDDSIITLTWTDRDEICRLLCESLRLMREATQAPEMIAHVYSNGYHTRLRIAPADLEELIMRCGWTITESIENLTPDARTEITRLQAQDFVQSQFSQDAADAARAWWTTRVIDRTPALTPDM
jgi:hypothetical protein